MGLRGLMEWYIPRIPSSHLVAHVSYTESARMRVIRRMTCFVQDEHVMGCDVSMFCHTCAFRMMNMRGKDTLHSNGGCLRLDAVHAATWYMDTVSIVWDMDTYGSQPTRVLEVLSSGPNLPEVQPTCKWVWRTYPQSRRPWKMWRPKFLITVINANDQISRVKLVKHRSNLGQPGSSPRKPRQWTLMNPLPKPTHTRNGPLAKDTVKTGLTVDVSECRLELLPRSPDFT
jgi:hypothetical protein